MISDWENECISMSGLSVARVWFPVVAEYLKGLSVADHKCSLVHVRQDQGVEPQLKQWVRECGAPWKNAFHLMMIMRCLWIKLVSSEQKGRYTISFLSPWPSNCQEWRRNWSTESLTQRFPECVIGDFPSDQPGKIAFEILRHSQELNPGYGEARQWDIFIFALRYLDWHIQWLLVKW